MQDSELHTNNPREYAMKVNMIKVVPVSLRKRNLGTITRER